MGDIVYLQKKKNEDYAEVQLIECKFSDEKYSKEELNFRKDPCMPKMINNICDYYPRTELIVSLVKKYHDEKRSILILSDRREHLKKINEKILYTFNYYDLGNFFEQWIFNGLSRGSNGWRTWHRTYS